jgi:hypothetical protein
MPASSYSVLFLARRFYNTSSGKGTVFSSFRFKLFDGHRFVADRSDADTNMLLKDGCDTVIHEHRKALTEILFSPQNVSGEDGVVRCHVTPY